MGAGTISLSPDSSDSVLRSPTNRSGVSKPSHKPPFTCYTLTVTILACIGGLLFGYDTGIMSGIQLFLPQNPGMRPMTAQWIEWTVSITPGTAAIGALIAGKASDSFGRRPIIVVASAIFAVGSLVCACGPGKGVVLVGRALLGFAIGFASMVIPIYISEAAPYHIRGRLVTMYQLMIATGFIVANAAAAVFAHYKPTTHGWRFMFGVAAIPSIVQFIGFMFLKDSPRYLFKKGQERTAEAVLMKVYGGDEEWVNYDMGVISAAVADEKRAHRDFAEQSTIGRIFRKSHVRRALVSGCLMQMFQQFVGINCILYYTSEIIKGAGVTDDITNLWISCGIAAVQSVGTFIPMKLIERLGRRPVLLISQVLLILALLGMGTSFVIISKDTGVNDRNLGVIADCNCADCTTSHACGFCHSVAEPKIGTSLPVSAKDELKSAVGACAYDWMLVNGTAEFAFDSKACSTKYTWLPIALMVFYLLGFAFGVGAMPWVYNAEIYPLWARSTCVSLSTFTNWVFNLAVSLTFLTITEKITKQGSFFLYAGLSIVGFLYYLMCIPETKGCNMEEIENLFKTESERLIESTKRPNFDHKAGVNSDRSSEGV